MITEVLHTSLERNHNVVVFFDPVMIYLDFSGSKNVTKISDRRQRLIENSLFYTANIEHA